MLISLQGWGFFYSFSIFISFDDQIVFLWYYHSYKVLIRSDFKHKRYLKSGGLLNIKVTFEVKLYVFCLFIVSIHTKFWYNPFPNNFKQWSDFIWPLMIFKVKSFILWEIFVLIMLTFLHFFLSKWFIKYFARKNFGKIS